MARLQCALLRRPAALSPPRPHILLTNDDGIEAPGLKAFHDALTRHFDVTVVAPVGERSGVSHSITLDSPLRVWPYENHGMTGWRVRGTPADCVRLAIRQLLERPVDLVASGVNRGNNVGVCALYSGTVAGAMEGAVSGLPALAISLCGWHEPDFSTAANLGAELCQRVASKAIDLPPGRLLSVNVPDLPASDIRGVRATRHAASAGIDDDYEPRRNPRGDSYYWLTGKFMADGSDLDTDVGAIHGGYVSVTPLQVDWTSSASLSDLRNTGLSGLLPEATEQPPAHPEAC